MLHYVNVAMFCNALLMLEYVYVALFDIVIFGVVLFIVLLFTFALSNVALCKCCPISCSTILILCYFMFYSFHVALVNIALSDLM